MRLHLQVYLLSTEVEAGAGSPRRPRVSDHRERGTILAWKWNLSCQRVTSAAPHATEAATAVRRGVCVCSIRKHLPLSQQYTCCSQDQDIIPSTAVAQNQHYDERKTEHSAMGTAAIYKVPGTWYTSTKAPKIQKNIRAYTRIHRSGIPTYRGVAEHLL